MSGNTFGSIFKITTFGESHGPALGVIIDGVPAGLELHASDIQKELDVATTKIDAMMAEKEKEISGAF